MTKTGMEMTTRVLISTRLSRKPPRLMAVSTPARMPMTVSIRTAIPASLRVVGYRFFRSSATGIP